MAVSVIGDTGLAGTVGWLSDCVQNGEYGADSECDEEQDDRDPKLPYGY